MKLYDTYSTYFVLIGLTFGHVVTLGLCIFWCYRFLFLCHDPTVYVLLVMFIGMWLAIDILLHKYKICFRLLVRCKFDSTGIFCHGFCMSSWTMPWDKIGTYGITGYSNPNQPFGIMFFSLDPNEQFDKKNVIMVNHKRVVFQVREEIWPKLSEFMPEDMKKHLRESINKQRDCFCKRHIS